MQQFRNVPYELEIVNLGSTFAKHGFDYRYFGKRGYNFAGQPQTLKEDHAILEQYQDHVKAGAVVVIPICPFGFSVYEYAVQRLTLGNMIYSKIKRIVKLAIGYDRAKRLEYEKLPVEEKSRFTAMNRVNSWEKEFSLLDTTQADPSEKLQRIFLKTRGELKDILLLCQRKQFHPVVVNMPVARAEYTLFSKTFVRKFYEDNVEAANVIGAPIFRYFEDERFGDALLYENYADCLNVEGQKRFAEILIQDLRTANLWEL